MQNDNKIDLSKLNKSKSVSDKVSFLDFFKSILVKKDGIKRDSEGKFTSGSGGLNVAKKLELKRVLPVVMVVAFVGGLLVFRSFAATIPKAPFANGKLLVLDTNSKKFPNSPSNYIPSSYLFNFSDESGKTDFASSVNVLNSSALPSIELGNDKYYNVGDHMNNQRFAFTKDGRSVIKVATDISSSPYKVKIYSYDIDGQNLKVLKESPEWYSSGENGCFTGQGCINDRTIFGVVGDRIVYETTKRPQRGSSERYTKIYTMSLDGTNDKELDVNGGNYQTILTFDQYNSTVIYSATQGVVVANNDGSVKRVVLRTALPLGNSRILRFQGLKTLPSPGGSFEYRLDCMENAVSLWGMPAETECKDKGSAYNNPENLTHIVYDYSKNNEIKSVFTNNDLRSMAGIPFSSGGRINLLDEHSLSWSPDGSYVTANFISYAYNTSTGVRSNPQPAASIIFDPFNKRLVKKISADNLEIYSWQPIERPTETHQDASTGGLGAKKKSVVR